MKELETYDTVVAINVDVQNDFCPGGTLAVVEGDAVVEPLNNLNRWVREQNGLVVFTRDWHPEKTTHFDNWPVHCVRNRAGAAFHSDLQIVNDTEYFTGTGNDLIVSKGMGEDEDGYSGFDGRARMDTFDSRGVGGIESVALGTLLKNFMRGDYVEATPGHNSFPAERRLDSMAIVVGGLATDYCVRATVLDALKFKVEIAEDYKPKKVGVFALENAMRAVNLQPNDGASALVEMEAAGAVLTTTDKVMSGEAFQVRVA